MLFACRQLCFIISCFIFLHLINSGRGTITESNMLNCDFYNTFCRWNNFVNGTNSLDWKIASVVATDFFHSIPRGVLGQGDMFAYVQGSRTLEMQTAFLVSDTIPCQLSNGKISFYLWSTVISPSGIELCIQYLTPTIKVSCIQSKIGYQGAEWKEVYANVAQTSVPFNFIIKAQVLGPQSIIGIDKIQYASDMLCDSEKRKPVDKISSLEEFLPLISEPAGSQLITDANLNAGTSQSLTSSEGACSAAECDFERDICNYEILTPEVNSNEALTLQCQLLKNHPKIRPLDGRCFLSLSSKGNKTVSVVLSSPSFFTYELTDLHFSYLLSSDKTSRLTVCLESLEHCVWDKQEPPRNWFIWWTERIELQPGRQQIFFVLEQLTEGVHVAIDNVRLFNAHTSDTTNCTLYF